MYSNSLQQLPCPKKPRHQLSKHSSKGECGLAAAENVLYWARSIVHRTGLETTYNLNMQCVFVGKSVNFKEEKESISGIATL